MFMGKYSVIGKARYLALCVVQEGFKSHISPLIRRTTSNSIIMFFLKKGIDKVKALWYNIFVNEREVNQMIIKNIPNIVGIDKVRIYQGNRVCAEQWIGGARLSWYFEEVETLKPFANSEIDYLEMCIEGCLSEHLTCEIHLK